MNNRVFLCIIQTMDSDYILLSTLLLIALVFFILLPILWIIPLQILAKKTNDPKPWLAWIPFANLYLMCKIGQKPGWWMLLLFIPLVQIIFFVLIWMGIAQVRQRPSWLGILILIPPITLLLPWYLALSDEKSV